MCWSPYIIFDMLQAYNLIPANKTVVTIATFIQSLSPLNSAANPLIYCLFSAKTGKLLSPCVTLSSCLGEEGDTTSSGQTNTSLLTGSSSSSARRG